VEWYYRTVAKYLAVPKGQAPIRSYELYSQSQHAAETLGFGELAASPRMVCGDVDHCVQKLTSVIQEYGFNELLYWPCIGGTGHASVASLLPCPVLHRLLGRACHAQGAQGNRVSGVSDSLRSSNRPRGFDNSAGARAWILTLPKTPFN
jgi:hypothetical protein